MKVSKKYFRNQRKVLKSKLTGGNLIQVDNTWQGQFDRKTKKLFIIHGGLHQKADVNRLCAPRKEVGKGIILIEECRNNNYKLRVVHSWL